MGVGDKNGVGLAVEVGGGVGVNVAAGVGVADAVAIVVAVAVRVAKRATRMVGLGVGVDPSATKSLKRQAIAGMAQTKKAKIIKFFRLTFPNQNKNLLYSIVRAGLNFLG